MSGHPTASRRKVSVGDRVGPGAGGAVSTGEPTSRFPVDAAAPLARTQDDHFAVTLVMSAPVLLSLRLCAAEAGVGEEALVARLVAEHASKLGIARLADFSDVLTGDLVCIGVDFGSGERTAACLAHDNGFTPLSADDLRAMAAALESGADPP